MKNYIISLLFITISISAFATEPVKTIQLNETKNFDYIVLKDLGTLYLTTDKRDVTIYFIDKNLDMKYSYLIDHKFQTSQTFLLEVFSDKEEFYLLYSPKDNPKNLNIIKGNNNKIVRTAEFEWKEVADDYFFDGENIVVTFNKRNKYVHRYINKNTLRNAAPVNIELPEVEGTWQLLGMRGKHIIYYGFMEPDAKYNKLEHAAIILNYVNKEGKLDKTSLLQIAPEKGKAFVPVSYATTSAGKYIGANFGTYLCPYSSNLYLYTYYKDEKKTLWYRQGVFIAALDPDINEPKIHYTTYIENIYDDDETSYSSPAFLTLENNYAVIIHEERKNKALARSMGTTSIIDGSGNLIIKEIHDEMDKFDGSGGLGAVPPDVYFAHSNNPGYFNEFLKYTSLANLPFRSIVKSMDEAHIKNRDIKFSVFRQNNEWVVLEFNKKTGSLNFYKA